MDPRYLDIFRHAPELAEALDPSELASLEHGLSEADPDVLQALTGWMTVRSHVCGELASDIPPPGLLALYAVADEPQALTDDERQHLDAARERIEHALALHPGLESVVERVRADRKAFYEMWEDDASVDDQRPVRADRPAMHPPRDRASRPSRWIWRAAAAAGLALFVAALIFIAQRDIGFETIQTAEDETRELVLPDGSEVHVGPNSTFAFRMAHGERQTRLTGEALFAVAAAEEPFLVETHEAHVHVVGTTFNVSSDATTTDVVLVQGVVDVHPRHDPEQVVRLGEGQRSRVVAGQAPEAPQPVDVAEALAWTGRWYFRATPLAEIATRLERHYGVRIIVPDELSDERVSGAFSQDVPVDETLQTLASALGTQVEREAPGVFRFAAVGE